MDKMNDILLTIAAFIAALTLTIYQWLRDACLWVKELFWTVLIGVSISGKKAAEYEEE